MVESISLVPEEMIPSETRIANDNKNDDINILLMGPSGVGKTTFINAFANYIKFDSLEDAEAGKMEVLIPSSFCLSGTGVEMDFEDQTISIGDADKYECFSTEGQSATQLCRSFVFRIGNRRLRLIDTPGVADCRGVEQDARNVQDTLTFIAQYDYLNAICILLKPNEERLTVPFQYCVKELLRHLHTSAKDNLMFLLTYARSTFYRPGKTKRLLEVMFEEHRVAYNVDIRITTQNTFLLDSEAFRYLAIRKHNIDLEEDQRQSYVKSWTQSVKECKRLLKYTMTLPKHDVQRMVSLNVAQQLIQKLPRPVAEVSRLIEENIQLAQQYQDRVGQNPSASSVGIPQNVGQVRQLTHPRTVCASAKCTVVVETDGEKKVEYKSLCHDNCYLKGVVQERLRHPNLVDCEEMNYETGECFKCGCHWTEHIHITYQLVADRTQYRAPVQYTASTTTSDSNRTLEDVRTRIGDLRQESQQIQDVYRRLVEFLQANAMIPINDGLVEYLNYFIREEETKQNANNNKSEIISQLQKLKTEHEKYISQLQNTLKARTKLDDVNSILKPEDIITLVKTLYALPINGSLIREQVENIQTVERESNRRQENSVETASHENLSTITIELKNILEAS